MEFSFAFLVEVNWKTVQWIGIASARRAVSSKTEEPKRRTVSIYSDALLDARHALDGVGEFPHSIFFQVNLRIYSKSPKVTDGKPIETTVAEKQ